MSLTPETPPVSPEPGAPAGQVAAGATIAVGPVVSPADARGALTKALRALTWCLPLDLPERAMVLQVVQAAIDTVGPAPEPRVCARCIERQAAVAVITQWAAPRNCRQCRKLKTRERGGADGHHD